MPTEAQKNAVIFVCQSLSDFYQPINLFRYDQKFKTFYILAGTNDNLAILIPEDGLWRFIDNDA